MSKSPNPFGFFAPTGGSFPAALPLNQAYSPSFLASSPNEYFVVVPARAANSHSSSVGSRTLSPRFINPAAASNFVASRQNFSASSSDSISTEFRGPFHLLGLPPITACHNSCVTSYLPIANGFSPLSRVLMDMNSPRNFLSRATCSTVGSAANNALIKSGQTIAALVSRTHQKSSLKSSPF